MAPTTEIFAMPSVMKEAHVHPDTSATLHDVPVPKVTESTHIIVKVIVSGCNPKDWKMPAGDLTTIAECPNSGDDVAGIVQAVGTGVLDFKPGDRVASLHQLGAPYGSYAEYALVHDHTTFKLPDSVAFEEAATMPMLTMMASIGLFALLKISPGLWVPVEKKTPLVVYGAASGVGSMAIKLARLVNVRPIIAIAGKGRPFVETLVDESKGDVILDYRDGPEAVVKGIQDALKGERLEYAFDAISIKSTQEQLARVLDKDIGKITLTLPGNRIDMPNGIEQTATMAGSLWKGLQSRDERELGNLGIVAGGTDFAYVQSRMVGRYLADGRVKAHPFEVVKGGLEGLEGALKNLRAGKVGSMKYVVRIRETPGLEG